MSSLAIVNGKCVYPKKLINLNRNVTEKEINLWKKLRKQGLTIREISEKVNRVSSVINYYITPNAKQSQIKGFKKYIMDRYDSKYKKYYRIKTRINQKKRYENDLDYRFYQACHGRCENIIKNWGSLENYYEYKKQLFKAEKDPSITKEQYNKIRKKLRSKHVLHKM